MQIDLSSHGMRIRGKSWEVRAKLRELAQSNLSLHDFLCTQTRTAKKNIVYITPSHNPPMT